MPKYKIKIAYNFVMDSEECPNKETVVDYLVELCNKDKWDVTNFELSYVINSDGSKSYDGEEI